MDSSDIFKPVARELQIVENSLAGNINTSLEILKQASTHLIKAGGKRLRPAFALLAARMYRKNIEDVIPLAIALELIHMATLVHDDVIDNSQTRRGADTVKQLWGNRISINSGNYVFARALSLIASYQRSDIVDILAGASMKICEGEIIQMLSAYNPNVGLKNYLRRIERKTALLISMSCQIGAMIVKAPPAEINALRQYGYYLGMAFQVTDDILDFIADEQVLGKPTGSDIRQGVITLPTIYALRHDKNREELARLLSSPQLCTEYADDIINMVIESDGIDYAYHITRHFSFKARKQLNVIPDVPEKKIFLKLVNIISERQY